jgi:hypothetical protein
MMDDPNGVSRPPGTDPYLNRRPRMPSASYGWGLPVGIAALFLLAGVVFYNLSSHGPEQTAKNGPNVIQTNPSGPERVSPGPMTTTPAPNR